MAQLNDRFMMMVMMIMIMTMISVKYSECVFEVLVAPYRNGSTSGPTPRKIYDDDDDDDGGGGGDNDDDDKC